MAAGANMANILNAPLMGRDDVRRSRQELQRRGGQLNRAVAGKNQSYIGGKRRQEQASIRSAEYASVRRIEKTVDVHASAAALNALGRMRGSGEEAGSLMAIPLEPQTRADDTEICGRPQVIEAQRRLEKMLNAIDPIISGEAARKREIAIRQLEEAGQEIARSMLKDSEATDSLSSSSFDLDSRYCQVYLPGSYRAGVSTATSDVDAVLLLPNVHQPDSLGKPSLDVFSKRLIAKIESLGGTASRVKGAQLVILDTVLRGIEMDVMLASVPKPILPIRSQTNLQDDAWLEGASLPACVALNGPRTTERILDLVQGEVSRPVWERQRRLRSYQWVLRLLRVIFKRRGAYKNVLGYFGGINCSIVACRAIQRWPTVPWIVAAERALHELGVWDFGKGYVYGCAGKPVLRTDMECKIRVWTRRGFPQDKAPMLTPMYPATNAWQSATIASRREVQREAKRASVGLSGSFFASNPSQIQECLDFLLRPASLVCHGSYLLRVTIRSEGTMALRDAADDDDDEDGAKEEVTVAGLDEKEREALADTCIARLRLLAKMMEDDKIPIRRLRLHSKAQLNDDGSISCYIAILQDERGIPPGAKLRIPEDMAPTWFTACVWPSFKGSYLEPHPILTSCQIEPIPTDSMPTDVEEFIGAIDEDAKIERMSFRRDWFGMWAGAPSWLEYSKAVAPPLPRPPPVQKMQFGFMRKKIALQQPQTKKIVYDDDYVEVDDETGGWGIMFDHE